MRTLQENYDLLKDNKYFQYFSVCDSYALKDKSRDELMEIYHKRNEEMKAYMTRYENPFMNIHHFDINDFKYFIPGDEVVVQEKIDGSNTHVRLHDGTFSAFGQNYELNEHNHLQGFWYYMNDNYKNIPAKYEGLDIYGEWLVNHHCEYPAECYGKFYVFDVMENGKYWPQSQVKALAEECGFPYAPVMYEGKFISWTHINSFVGKTLLGGDKGEGVIVKNQTRLNKTNVFYTKVVALEFQEVAKRANIKIIDMDKVLQLEDQNLLAQSIVTPARTRKIIFKLIDDNELSADWQRMPWKSILGTVNRAVIKDCQKEEPETVAKIGKTFGKYVSDLVTEQLKLMQSEQ